ncbi:DUF6263 family protein [Xanthovirga aplysinae]|uniref:DUF6263 family protein n=1 Tax=Xanthovirga aplysinae TaxID=2529853 RepID=UPI0012BD3DBF|nr:DUF6263 family protein [Xanthovirga aplysinae]MTI32170.1 hypothetical protein [Xanthovirga aplysinae]
MRTSFLKPVLLAIVLCWSTALAYTEERGVLSFNLKVGETYRLKTVSEQNIKQTILGRRQDMNSRMTSIFGFKILQKDSANTVLMEVVYESLAMEVKASEMQMKYDSESNGRDTTNFMAGVYDQIIGKPFKVSMSATGELKEISGLEALIEELVNKYGKNDELLKFQLKTNLNNLLGEDGLKSHIGTLTAIYPATPVKEGESWSNQLKISSSMSYKVDNKWTLEGVDNGELRIKGESVISVPEGGGQSNMNGMVANYQLSGTQVSEVVAEEESGWIKSSIVKQNIEGKVEIKKNEYFPEGVSWPVIFESLVKVSRPE